MALFRSKAQQQADREDLRDTHFSKAMTRAFLEEMKGFPFRKAKRLLPFEAVKEQLDLWFVKDIGLLCVRLDAIIGSQGRYRDFTRHFFPLEENMRTRWKNVEKAVSSRKEMPPVELYKVGDAYFVKDGHHRISVARARKRQYIDARVYEYECDVPLSTDTDVEQLAILATCHRFLKETGLKKTRNADLNLSRIGGYPILMQHIQTHQHYLETKESRSVSLAEAAASWYDRIYTPFVEIIKKHGIMTHFPHRTCTDFYIWVMKFREKFAGKSMEAFDSYEAESLVGEYARIFTNPLRKFVGFLKRISGLVKY